MQQCNIEFYVLWVYGYVASYVYMYVNVHIIAHLCVYVWRCVFFVTYNKLLQMNESPQVGRRK